LQLAKGVDAKAVDGAEALDIAIDVLSGRDQAHLGSARGREAAKTAITTRVRATPAYGKKVLSLYFTDFVMQ
jgi:flagellar basal body-associated protein FliL